MFNIIKCYKVKKTALTKVSNHTHRTKLTEEEQNRIKMDLSHQNRILVGSNVSADIRGRIKNYSTNKTRKDAVYAEHYIISASGDFFKENPNKFEDWVNNQIEFLRSEFGPNLTTAVLHNDETTPHIEAFVTPIIKNPKNDRLEVNRKSFNESRGGLNSFKRLQDRHYEYNLKFGLKRGISKELTGVSAKTLNEYYLETKDFIENGKNLSNSISPEKLVPEKTGFFKNYTREEVLMIVKRTKRIKENILKSATIYKHKFRDLYEKYQNLYKKLLKKYNELEKENKRILEEKAALIEKNKEMVVMVKNVKQVAELGCKVMELGITKEIEQRFENAQEKEGENTPDSTLKKDKKNLFDIGGL